MGHLILVVDDTSYIREAVADLLESAGYASVLASDGQAALDALRKGPAPAAILLDLVMPRMNGVEFRQRQLADPALAGIPAILMTANPALVNPQFQVDHVLLKPFTPGALFRALERVLEKGDRSAAVPHG